MPKLSNAQKSELFQKANAIRRRRQVRRYRPGMSGRGGYFADQGAKYGEQFGSMAGARAGKVLGRYAGEGAELAMAQVPKVLSAVGLGDYKVSQIRHNVFLRGDPPYIKNMKSQEGATIIRHREYLGDIISASDANTFSIQSFSLNPAQQGTFPWLAQIAAQYEEYVPNGMVWEFKSTASDAIASSTNLSLGEVIMATQYDSLNPPFVSNVQMLNYEFAQSCKVSESAMHMIECDPRQSPLSHLYTRTGTVPGNSDIRLYDFGTFYIATNGLQGESVNVGQLWVSYEFLFFKARASIGSLTQASMYKWFNAQPNATWLFNPAGVQVNPENNLAIAASGSTILFPNLLSSCTYLVQLCYNTLGSVTAAVPNMTMTNCVRVKAFSNNTLVLDSSPQVGATGISGVSFTFYITTVPNLVPSVVIATSSAPSGGSQTLDGCITQVAYLDPAIYGTG